MGRDHPENINRVNQGFSFSFYVGIILLIILCQVSAVWQTGMRPKAHEFEDNA